jgi:catechol 2,3-dioxygenase
MMAPLVTPRGLGEVVLRVSDMPRAISFYRDVLGLGLLRAFDDRIVFLKVEDGFEGHDRIIGLFRADQPSNRDDTEWLAPDLRAPLCITLRWRLRYRTISLLSMP